MNDKIPRTPFSTALSGSARMTELRLKHIFSGPKKRPPALFLALMFSLCVFCGNLVSFQAQAAESNSPASMETGLGLISTMIDRFRFLLITLQTNAAHSEPDNEDWSWADKMNAKDWNWDWDDKWDDALEAEYRAVGVTKDGKNYYYQDQLANIFLDIRPNKSFYTLDLNPKGTVNIKIVRSADNKITGVAYMTEAEAEELLEDMRDD